MINESERKNMFNLFKKTKTLSSKISMFNVDVTKYYKNKDVFNSALKDRKQLKSLKLKDFKPIEQ
tara:strand:+ start:591 stop:785 length:195 start_codon:yes stop_codon:yes gene_type:complete